MDRSPNRAWETEADENRAKTSQKSTRGDQSTPVEWQNIAEKQPVSATTTSPTTGSTSIADTTVTDRIQSQSGPSLTIETNRVTATLVGVPKVSIEDLVYAHYRDTISNSGDTRFCAMFDVENTSDKPIRWRSQRTTFIGSDGYTYDQAHVALDAAVLAPGCHTTTVLIEPGCRARVVTPVEQLPENVDVAKVIHSVSARGDVSTQRLIFNL